MSDMFCIIAIDYLVIAIGQLTIPTDHSQTIHLSQQTSDIFCIITTDNSVVAMGYLTISTDYLYVATDDVTTNV